MSKRLRVYIAGPITLGDWETNFESFAEAQHQLMREGFAPFNPGLSMRLPDHDTHSHEAWLECCLPWVEQADLVVRLGGESKGADMEVLHALEHGVPVVCHAAYKPSEEVLCACTTPLRPSHFPVDVLPAVAEQLVAEARSERLSAQSSCEHTCAVKCSPEPEVYTPGPFHANDEGKLAAIREERGKVYGEPKQNHEGIAMMWAPLLEPHADDIAAQRPLPAYTIAHMMVALKLDRMRLRYHEDNYDDLRNYLGFAQDWQREGVS